MNQKQAARLKSLVTAMKEKQQALQNNFSTSGYQAWIAACDAVENYIIDITVPDNPVGDFYNKHLEVIGDFASLSPAAIAEFNELPHLLKEFHLTVVKYRSVRMAYSHDLVLREELLYRGIFLLGYIHQAKIDVVVELSKFNVAISSILEHIRNE